MVEQLLRRGPQQEVSAALEEVRHAPRRVRLVQVHQRHRLGHQTVQPPQHAHTQAQRCRRHGQQRPRARDDHLRRRDGGRRRDGRLDSVDLPHQQLVEAAGPQVRVLARHSLLHRRVAVARQPRVEARGVHRRPQGAHPRSGLAVCVVGRGERGHGEAAEGEEGQARGVVVVVVVAARSSSGHHAWQRGRGAGVLVASPHAIAVRIELVEHAAQGRGTSDAESCRCGGI